MKLWIEALANLLSNNILQTADNLVGNFLGELLAAIMTEAFRRTVPEEKLGWVNFQNLGNEGLLQRHSCIMNLKPHSFTL